MIRKAKFYIRVTDSDKRSYIIHPSDTLEEATKFYQDVVRLKKINNELFGDRITTSEYDIIEANWYKVL